MRPRFVINKGIRKKITAISADFVLDEGYVAVIYNPKDLSTKITAYADCEEVNEKKTLAFTFLATDTALLKVGFATIEIYDVNHTLMVYRDNFGVIRDNSFRISGDDPSSES